MPRLSPVILCAGVVHIILYYIFSPLSPSQSSHALQARTRGSRPARSRSLSEVPIATHVLINKLCALQKWHICTAIHIVQCICIRSVNGIGLGRPAHGEHARSPSIQILSCARLSLSLEGPARAQKYATETNGAGRRRHGTQARAARSPRCGIRFI